MTQQQLNVANRSLGACQAFLLSLVVTMAAMAGEVRPSDSATTDKDVATLIRGLRSIKDYERLQWVLNAIDQQEPSARAGLLKQLDERIDQLAEGLLIVRAEARPEAEEAREPSEPIATDSAAPTGDESSETQEVAAESSEPQVDAQQMEASKRLSLELNQTLGQVRLARDPFERMNQVNELSSQIANVLDPAQRDELNRRLDELFSNEMRNEIETRQREIMAKAETNGGGE